MLQNADLLSAMAKLDMIASTSVNHGSMMSDFTKIVADVLANPYVRTSCFALIA